MTEEMTAVMTVTAVIEEMTVTAVTVTMIAAMIAVVHAAGVGHAAGAAAAVAQVLAANQVETGEVTGSARSAEPTILHAATIASSATHPSQPEIAGEKKLPAGAGAGAGMIEVQVTTT